MLSDLIHITNTDNKHTIIWQTTEFKVEMCGLFYSKKNIPYLSLINIIKFSCVKILGENVFNGY